MQALRLVRQSDAFRARYQDERLGKLHFWRLFVGFHTTFEGRLPDDVESSIYRLVQEGLPLLRSISKEAGRISDITAQISALEGRADDLHDAGLQDLYKANVAGNKALDFLRRYQMHVIISDQRMPIMTGVDLLRQSRDISPRSVRYQFAWNLPRYGSSCA